jgi:1-deoxy-D-xylulose-5-phosphate synthase
MGIEAEVINARFVKPFDADAICQSAARTGHLVTIEENVRTGGFGESVLAMLHERGVEGFRVKTLGLPDKFVEHGAIGLLRSKCGLDVEGVVRAAAGRYAPRLKAETASPAKTNKLL